MYRPAPLLNAHAQGLHREDRLDLPVMEGQVADVGGSDQHPQAHHCPEERVPLAAAGRGVRVAVETCGLKSNKEGVNHKTKQATTML